MVDIKSNSWKNIITTGREKRLGKTTEGTESIAPNAGDFFLSFDAPADPKPPKVEVTKATLKTENWLKEIIPKQKTVVSKSIKIDPIVVDPIPEPVIIQEEEEEEEQGIEESEFDEDLDMSSDEVFEEEEESEKLAEEASPVKEVKKGKKKEEKLLL